MATGASDFFTHDLEDMSDDSPGYTQGNAKDNQDLGDLFSKQYLTPQKPSEKGPSEPQMRRLHAIAKKGNWSESAQKELLAKKFNYTHSRSLMPWYMYRDFTDYMDKNDCVFDVEPTDTVDEFEGRSDESL